MNDVRRCEWCSHAEANHEPEGCAVVLCSCALAREDLVSYALAVALQQLRDHWYA